MLMLCCWCQAKVDLVTLPQRDSVQLTIYNAADLTLAREQRDVILAPGRNRLQFSWENTLIDPTSLDMVARARAAEIDIAELTFPPRVKNLGLWNIHSETSGAVPVEISYLTSGLSWRAFYMGTLSADETTMQLQGYVRVTNQSGEDYENAQVRLVVGKVQVLDAIAALARRAHPYGRPGEPVPESAPAPAARSSLRRELKMATLALDEAAPKKEIRKEGLSEYFLYTIEGTETIPTGWSKRLESFSAAAVPVVNRYKFDAQRYGSQVIRFLSFHNDRDHQLGETPIPEGLMRIFGAAGDSHLAYVGASRFKYIPVGEEVELNLGPTQAVIVKPTLMDFQQEQFRFDSDRELVGWDELRSFQLELRNTRGLPVEVEVRRHLGTAYWNLEIEDAAAPYEKIDAQTVEFLVTLPAHSQRKVEYTLRTYHGTRESDVR
jgi:hypothetical protein